MVNMRIERAVQSIHSFPEAWVRLEEARKTGDRLELSFGTYKRRRGRKTSSWDVTCLGVRETQLSDFDGGGLALYSSTHPAARQYRAKKAELRWATSESDIAFLGALYRAHCDAVDDWIPFDRYIDIYSLDGKRHECEGPDFLLRSYAKAFRLRGVKAHLKLRKHNKGKVPTLRVLHFGESYIVAADFSAEQRATKPTNVRLKPT